MALSIQLDAKAVTKALEEAPERLAAEMRKGLQKFQTDFVAGFRKRKMIAGDDRDGSDFLNRRPSGSKGLRRRTGGLARAFVEKTEPAKTIADLKSVIGFTNPTAARIASVHEFGTVGKGGTLPDIVPKRARFLAVPVFGTNASRASKPLRIVLLKRVSIPPRLGFLDEYLSPQSLKLLTAELDAGVARALAPRKK